MSASMSMKTMKKWKKICTKLENGGLPITLEESCHVAVANGGLGNGVNINQLRKLFDTYGKVTNILSLPKISYAVVSFEEVSSAVNCFNALQASTIEKSAEVYKSVLYLYYLNSFPSNLSNSSAFNTISSENLPSGLFKYDDFITTEEEDYLLEKIDFDISTASKTHVHESLKQRTVLHYGYRFQYGSNDVDCSSPLCNKGLPDYSLDIVKKLMNTDHFRSEPDQLTINKYEPGDGIPPHIDNPTAFEEPLATISLGSSIVMEMKSEKGQKVSILLKPRTLLIFTGDSRYLWTHGITAKKTDLVHEQSSEAPHVVQRQTRVSMTFRKVVFEKQMHSSLPSNDTEAVGFEKELVHNVYNKIAYHFSCTREKPWPRVVDFLRSLKPGSVVIDVGCGSGRYLNVNSEIFMVGCDYCSSLISVCSLKQCPVFICDGLNIPVRSNSFDACICIAVIHHFSSFQRQLSAVNELLRVLSNGGLCLIYVWAAEQKQNNIKSSYLKPNTQQTFHEPKEGFQQNSSQSLVVHKNRTEFVQQDVLVPWKTKSNVSKSIEEKFGKKSSDIESTYYRYYHVFKQNELEDLCSDIPNCRIIDSYYDNGNWSVTLKKH